MKTRSYWLARERYGAHTERDQFTLLSTSHVYLDTESSYLPRIPKSRGPVIVKEYWLWAVATIPA